ncbi:MAG: hypothetical protein ACO1O1_04670 [Adhaeribacter sp.]
MMKRWIVLAFLVAGLLPLAQAQQTDTLRTGTLTEAGQGQYNLQKRNREFFDRVVSFSPISWVTLPFTDLGYKDPKSPFILSADISPQFNIGGESWPVALQISPRYKVRILRDQPADGDSSLPVRTPSYMPGATLLVPISHSPLKRARNYRNAPELANGYRDLHYIGLAVFHHSNGQDGREINPDGTYNTYNGNFSTNFVEASYHFNIRKRLGDVSPVDCPNQEYPVGYRDYYGKAGFEQHFSSNEALPGRYGLRRVNLSFGWLKVDNYQYQVAQSPMAGLRKSKQLVGQCYRRERHRFQANLTVNIDALHSGYGALHQRINFDFGFFRRILGGNTAAFVMAGYYGNDPYNVYFENSYPFIRAGLALGFFTFTNKID